MGIKAFKYFSWPRLVAIIIKEFTQLLRDHLTFAMIAGIPIMQIILFGYAINTNPKNLPTALLLAENTAFTRTFATGLTNTEYFKIDPSITSEKKAHELLSLGRLQFVINVPPDLTRRLLRGLRPQISVEADATDPVATGSAVAAVQNLMHTVFNPLFLGDLQTLREPQSNVDLVVHNKYNPENITPYNIVPGLLGVILTMTMVIIASMVITREREHGTIENLLATPARSLEIMIGKIIPFIVAGYIQVILILLAAYFLFHVPMQGSITLLFLCCLPFIAVNLSIGVTFSSLAKTQLQGAQMAIFYFLPSMLLSGFMFPYYGMPTWAQWVGNMLPLTYFLRISRGILLKGNDFALVWQDLWPILVYMVITMLIGVSRFRRTLD